jgi:hypothetical protein
MIIDAKTIVITLAIIGIAGYFGLHLIRSFALSIAQENHDANLATDMSIEAKRARREQEADAAAMAAFAKVEPLLPASVMNKGMNLKAKAPDAASKPAQAPSGGGLQTPLLDTRDVNNNHGQEEKPNISEVVDEEAREIQPAEIDYEVDEEALASETDNAADIEER